MVCPKAENSRYWAFHAAFDNVGVFICSYVPRAQFVDAETLKAQNGFQIMRVAVKACQADQIIFSCRCACELSMWQPTQPPNINKYIST